MMADSVRDQDGWGRVIRYAVFGPLIGMFVFFGMIMMPRSGFLSWHLIWFVVVLPVLAGPVAYFVGFLPAVIVGMIDRLMLKRQIGALWRLLTVTTLGFACGHPIARLMVLEPMAPPSLPGLVGAVPALLCFIWCDFFSRSGPQPVASL